MRVHTRLVTAPKGPETANLALSSADFFPPGCRATHPSSGLPFSLWNRFQRLRDVLDEGSLRS